MLLLALDTSAGLGVAVADSSAVLAARTETDPRAHAELLTPTIAAVLRQAGVDRRDLTAVAVGVGPAPFTGLRVGVVTALVLGEALGIAVHGVPSLDAVALTAVWHVPALRGADGSEFVVATDARRREVHWGVYRVEGVDAAGAADAAGAVAATVVHCVDGPHVDTPAEAARGAAGRPVVGSGATRYADALPGPAGREAADALDPGALAVLARTRLDTGVALLPARPLYLRRPDAVELATRPA